MCIYLYIHMYVYINKYIYIYIYVRTASSVPLVCLHTRLTCTNILVTLMSESCDTYWWFMSHLHTHYYRTGSNRRQSTCCLRPFRFGVISFFYVSFAEYSLFYRALLQKRNTEFYGAKKLFCVRSSLFPKENEKVFRNSWSKIQVQPSILQIWSNFFFFERPFQWGKATLSRQIFSFSKRKRKYFSSFCTKIDVQLWAFWYKLIVVPPKKVTCTSFFIHIYVHIYIYVHARCNRIQSTCGVRPFRFSVNFFWKEYNVIQNSTSQI